MEELEANFFSIQVLGDQSMQECIIVFVMVLTLLDLIIGGTFFVARLPHCLVTKVFLLNPLIVPLI